MDLPNLLMFCLISLVIGAVLMLIVQYYIYVRFCDMPSVSNEQKYFNEKYAIPHDIRTNSSKFDAESKSPLMAVNLIMQFLFHEVKHATNVRRWFYKKLTLELDELVTKTTIGKLFEKLTIRDLDLGDHFPEIKLLRVHDVEFHEVEGRIEILDVILEIKYTGNFRMTIDANMVLGKKASLTLKVRNLAGLARLQFTRKPYTHWSLSFLGDPDLDLGIESKFQGRQMQSNVSSLISNQIRRAVRRKHTLPKYKIRYKPFFPREQEETEGDINPNGCLNVKILELSRLLIPNTGISKIFCTLTMGSIAWVEAIQVDDANILVSIDIKIPKAKNQQIGILFKQGQSNVEIEAVLPNTPAVKSNLKAGDVLYSIEATRINSIQQVAKVIKGLHKPVLNLRVNRIIRGVLIKDLYDEPSMGTRSDMTDAPDISEGPDESMKADESSITSILSADQISIDSAAPSVRQRRRSNTSIDSMISNTPSSSPKKLNILGRTVKRTLSKEPSDTSLISDTVSHRSKGLDDTSSIHSFLSLNAQESIANYQQHTTVEFSVDRLISIEDICQFKLDGNSLYLNLCVYGKQAHENVLLGYRNISIRYIMSECSETTLYEIERQYNLMPSTINDFKSHYIASLAGFNAAKCFGDILMTFAWNGNPYQSEVFPKKPIKPKTPVHKAEESEKSGISVVSSKQHNFVRKHFDKATQCDYCGKKIWLKDAVQCTDCLMVSHKKCIIKCQNSTVCGPKDIYIQPEFTVTEVSLAQEENADEPGEVDLNAVDLQAGVEATPRQSLSAIITQNLKRVNSANNLCIPVLSAAVSQSSKSLPPSPQHSPHLTSLNSQDAIAFQLVTKILDAIPNDIEELSEEQMDSITDPIIAIHQNDDIMSLAKIASKDLFPELTAEERVRKISELLTKLRLALDSATADHSKLMHINRIENVTVRWQMDESQTNLARNANHNNEAMEGVKSDETHTRPEQPITGVSNLDKSEERVQALSVLMLFFCTGLQHAQGVAPP